MNNLKQPPFKIEGQ